MRQFVDIDKGKRLSVGPASLNHKTIVSPVEEMHSLNFGYKMREYSRIDEENEKLIHILGSTSSAVIKRDQLIEHQELTKKLNNMLSKGKKNSVD